jgi:hypothetical protein
MQSKVDAWLDEEDRSGTPWRVRITVEDPRAEEGVAVHVPRKCYRDEHAARRAGQRYARRYGKMGRFELA